MQTSCDDSTCFVRLTLPACVRFLPFHLDIREVALSRIGWKSIRRSRLTVRGRPRYFSGNPCQLTGRFVRILPRSTPVQLIGVTLVFSDVRA